MLGHLPAAPKALLTSGKFTGELILARHKDSMRELKLNKVWLSPLLDLSPQTIPSAYMLTDMCLLADSMLDGEVAVYGRQVSASSR